MYDKAGADQDFKLAGRSIKKKKYFKYAYIYIYIYIELKNYKYSKSLFLNTLRCNHLPTKTKPKTKNKIMFFLILGWLGFFIIIIKVRAFTVVVL